MTIERELVGEVMLSVNQMVISTPEMGGSPQFQTILSAFINFGDNPANHVGNDNENENKDNPEESA